MRHSSPITLVILDGFGLSAEITHNAIAQAHTPHLDQIFKRYPNTQLDASGRAVGLPDGQMGNSEVGHLHLGAGRRLPQILTRLDENITSGQLFNQTNLIQALTDCQARDGKVHVMGLFSDGGVHSHINHLYGMIDHLREKGLSVFCHAFLDGRDTPPQSAEQYLRDFLKRYASDEGVHLATLSGRYYAMDRDQRWDRTALVYQMIHTGQSVHSYPDALTALHAYYEQGITDEFLPPTCLSPARALSEQDLIIWMNFRADRAKQLLRAFHDARAEFIDRQAPAHPHLLTLTKVDDTFEIPMILPPAAIANTLGEVLSQAGYQQKRIAETEKYAHVTFFFNGGEETPFPGETRELIPSPKVSTYDKTPAMSAKGVTDAIVQTLQSKNTDVIIANYANPDMVGHTGQLAPTIVAIEAIDEAMGTLLDAHLKAHATLLITADHGNAECLFDPTKGNPHTAHTCNPVPFIVIGPDVSLSEQGTLADVAPTMLDLMGEKIPKEMTGQSLIKKDKA